MLDLDERFRSLYTVRTPDLWTQIEARAPKPPKGTPRRWPAAAVAFAVAVAGLTFAVSTFGGGGGSSTPSTTETNGRIAFSRPSGRASQIFTMEPDGSDIQQVTDLATGEDAFQPSWSPDGERIAFIVQQSGRSNIFIVRSDGTGLTQVTHDGNDFEPSWSPDGARLAFSRGDPELGTQDIWVMNADGDHATALTHETNGNLALSPSWSQDGSAILFVSNESGGTELYRMRSDGTHVVQLTSDDGFHGSPRYSPGGTQIAFAGDVNGPGVYLISNDGSRPKQLTHDLQVGPIDVAWSPDGRFLVYSTSTGGHSIDLYTVDLVDGSTNRLTTSGDVCCPAWQSIIEPPTPTDAPAATNGRIAFAWYDGTSFQIYTANADGTDVNQVTHMSISVSDPSWSPDGSKIAFQGETVAGEGGRLDIYVSNADGTGIRQLTHSPDSYQNPAWSPDGTTIAATRWSASDGHGDVVLLPLDGSSDTVVTHGPGDSWRPEWSPDGSRLAYVSNRDANGDLNDEIWVVNTDGSDARDLTGSPAYDRDPTWSPDGARIAYFSGPQGSPNLDVVDVGGGGATRTIVPNVEDGGSPAWSPDGTEIAFVKDDPRLGTGRLEIVNLASGQVTTPLDLVGVGSPAWQPASGAAPSTPRESPSSSSVASVSDPIPIESSPGAVSSLAYGFDSMWVASFDASQQGWLTRLDVSTGDIVARISTANVFPTWEVGGGELAMGFGSVWMAGASPANGEPSGVHAYLVRIDPTTNAVVGTIDLHASDPADVAIDDRGVWVMSFGLGEHQAMEVSLIDPGTNHVVATTELDSWYGHHLFSVGGWIVASTNAGTGSAENGGGTPEGVLNVIDPTTETEVRTIPVGPSASPAAADDQLWIATGDALERIDPSSGQVLERDEVPNTGDALAVGDGGVWFLDPQGRNGLERFDPTVEEVDLHTHLSDGTTPIAMTTSPGAVWALNYEGTVTRVGLN